MKILVIDDNGNNREAARALLKEHEITTVGSYDEGQAAVKEAHDFEVVLVDLLMPASAQTQGPKGDQYVGKEMPVGIFLALLAAKNGAKYVAVFSDSDHHSHPASACFDAFNKYESEPTPFNVNGAKIILSNTRMWIEEFDAMNMEKPLESGKECQIKVRAKNWKQLLNYLLTA